MKYNLINQTNFEVVSGSHPCKYNQQLRQHILDKYKFEKFNGNLFHKNGHIWLLEIVE